MARGNNVRGPTSALTDFLRDSGITPAFIARRARTANNNTTDPAAAAPATTPDNVPAPAGGEEGDQRRGAAGQPANGYNSDHLDESEEERPATKKRKLTKAAEAKLKAKEKAKAKKKGGGDEDDDDEEDMYTALSKSMYKSTKPPIGSFEDCARCKKQFTVTKYTVAAAPPPGFLCHACAKAGGSDPFKKPAPKKRKPAADKRKIVNEENRFPSLVSMCVEVISKHIEDVEALGDVGSMNVDAIAKALARNRSLTAENVPLFYDIQNKSLKLYDVTKLNPAAFCAMASLNPNLTSLCLEFCGCIDDTAINAWCTSMPNLTRLELLGPFLVRAPAWKAFFKSHTKLEGFLITQSPRFDLECAQSLISNCPGLQELRLKEVGLMSDEMVEIIGTAQGGLTLLDLAYPGKPYAVSELAFVDLIKQVGSTLLHLNLSGNKNLTDVFLTDGIQAHARVLETLKLANLESLTDEGVSKFFTAWSKGKTNPPLATIDMSRNHELSGAALSAMLRHSGPRLEVLNINAWKATSQEALMEISDFAPRLVKVDLGFCRETDDFVIKALMDKCEHLKEIKCWGCNVVTGAFPRKRKVNVYGVEVQC